MAEGTTHSSQSQSGSQSQVPPAQQVTTEVDGFTVASASAIAPHTEETLKAAVAETEPTEEVEDRRTGRLVDHDEPPPVEREAAAEGEDGDESEAPPPPKKQQSAKERHEEIQARINAATRELRETERRIAAAREEAERLSRQPQTPPPPADDAPTERPRWKTFEEEGKSYHDYEEALAKWDEARDQRNQAVVERRLQEQAHAENLRQQEAAWEARANDSKTRHPDWEEKIKTNLKDVDQTPFLRAIVKGHPKGADIFYDFAQKPDVARAWGEYDTTEGLRPTPPIASALNESANPSAMLEYLANNREEYARLVRMPPVTALLALGKLETALSGAKNGSPGRPVSHAAPPLSHRAGSQQSSGASRQALDDMDIEDFVRSENKREGRRSPV